MNDAVGQKLAQRQLALRHTVVIGGQGHAVNLPGKCCERMTLPQPVRLARAVCPPCGR
jgi:hypothetical protein